MPQELSQLCLTGIDSRDLHLLPRPQQPPCPQPFLPQGEERPRVKKCLTALLYLDPEQGLGFTRPWLLPKRHLTALCWGCSVPKSLGVTLALCQCWEEGWAGTVDPRVGEGWWGPPGKLWHEGGALDPLQVLWGGERPELAPQSPCAGLAGGDLGVSLCSSHCGCSAKSMCVPGPAGAPRLQILGGSWGSIQRGPAGGQCCWEGLWATSCPRGE